LDKKRGGTFDCGVQGQFTQESRSSRHDMNIIRDIVPHYRKLEEILEVSYDAHSKFDIFKCKWFKVNLASANQIIFQNECGHTRLKTFAISFQPSHWQTSEPFTFSNHVEQCFYLPFLRDPKKWSFIVTYVPHSRYIIGEKPEVLIITALDQDEDLV
jgi:hypothetical protein